jgi:hypothetical protein
MTIGNSGVLAAAGALALCAGVVSTAGSWALSGFDRNAPGSGVAQVWGRDSADRAKLAQSPAQPRAPKIGDENFWLSGLTVARKHAAGQYVLTESHAHKLAVGDRMSLASLSGANILGAGDGVAAGSDQSGAQTLEVVDIKALAAELVPASAGAAVAGYVMVTYKVVGMPDGAPGSIVRVILEDVSSMAGAAAALPGLETPPTNSLAISPANKAL